MGADPGRLERIFAALPAEDVAFLSTLIEPPWRQRQRRLAHRDNAIRGALALLAGDPNPAARLALLMARQVGERGGTTGDHLVAEAVAGVLALNDGVPMTERHLRNLAAGDRTPRK